MIDFNTSYIGLRLDILKYVVGKNNVVLDVGCATGTNGRYMLENKLARIVYGIEFQKGMAIEAAKSNTKIFQGNLDNIEFRKVILTESPQFDYILFGDILEHLIDPENVLKELTKNLKPGGKVIISLPNVAHIELFVQVYIKGTWPKNPRGIFDCTHLRWFTRKDANLLVENCSLKVIKYERNFRARDRIGSTFNWKYKMIKWLNKDWVTFQHILICTNEI
jgi:2-polyprenyl-3-methyl-5-hydroxy-6-metoxy-1,4-benzoquinol methylase